MDRTFQSKVDKWYWMILAISSVFLFYCFWVHLVLLALLGGLVVVFEIEMLVHTRYVVMHSGILRIESGRFVPGREIQMETIRTVRHLRSWRISKPALSVDCVEIEYGTEGRNERVCISPKNVSDFIRCLSKHSPGIRIIPDESKN